MVNEAVTELSRRDEQVGHLRADFQLQPVQAASHASERQQAAAHQQERWNTVHQIE